MIELLAQKLRANETQLNRWWEEKTKNIWLPVTCSVDIRNAGYKIAGIDTNLFPAGFNNLCNNFRKQTSEAFANHLRSRFPKAKKILLIPESFTRNLNYFQNVKTLETLLTEAGFIVRVGFIGEPLPSNPHEVSLAEGSAPLLLYRAEKQKNRLGLTDFDPDLIFLNNDCSAGIPEALLGLQQPILPNPELGWHARSKYHHFQLYCHLIGEWAPLMGVDPWHFCPLSNIEKEIDVEEESNRQRLASAVTSLLAKIQAKYDEHHITEKPYVFLKDNAGTFGLGVLAIESPEEILNLNRKKKKQLTTSKGKEKITSFLIQEGIPTIDQFQGAPVEPVFYFVGGTPIGGFFRIHADKDNRSSLNSPGAKFDCLCLHKTKELSTEKLTLHCKNSEDLFDLARWLGRIACLAGGLEEKELQREP